MSRPVTGRDISAVWLALLLALVLPPAVSAESPNGIDLVVLIDQSGSMWGHPDYHPDANDRYDHRIGATRAVVQRLVADVESTSRVHRVSVVDFGDDATVSWSNERISFDPSEPLALRRRVDVEMARRVVAQQWLNTNTPAALAAAFAEHRKMDTDEHLPGRRRLVLLITDGRPQLPPATPTQMKDRVKGRARELLAEGVELWVVGLNDAKDYWNDGDGAFWQALVGHADRTHLADRAVPELPKGIHRMLDDWLGVVGPPSLGSDETYEAPPYLGRLAFRVTFDKPRDPDSVRITSPDGRVVSRVSGGGPADPSTEARFLMDDPAPGEYTVTSDRGPQLVVPEPHPPKILRIAPTTGADLDVESRVVYGVSTSSGRPLKELADWPLALTLIVESPDGRSTQLPATLELPGKIVSRWRPATPGVHTLRLVGAAEVGDETLDVFADAPGAETEVVVSNARPLWLKLERPLPISGIRATPWDRRTDLRISWVDSTGARVDPAEVLSELEGFLEVELLDPSGVAEGPAIPLEIGERGQFEASLPIEPDWRGSAGLFGLGEIYLRVNAATERLPEDVALRGIQLPEEIETARVAGDPFTMGPVPVRLSRSMSLGILMVVFLLFVALVAYLAMRVVPSWRIGRRDAAARRSVKLRVYDIMSDPSGAQADEKRVTGGSTFKLDGLRLVIDGETLVADRLRLVRLDAPGRPRARLTYRWQGEKKTKTTLLTAGGGPKTLRVERAVKGRPVADLTDG